MNKTGEQEHIKMSYTMNIPYHYSAGTYLSKFFEEIKDNEKIYANKCPKCGRLHCPPRILCGRCHVRMGEWVDQGKKGTVINSALSVEPFWDSTIGAKRVLPVTANILLDGGAVIFHALEEKDVTKLHEGMRVEAVFAPKEQRQGYHWTDILYFKTIEE